MRQNGPRNRERDSFVTLVLKELAIEKSKWQEERKTAKGRRKFKMPTTPNELICRLLGIDPWDLATEDEYGQAPVYQRQTKTAEQHMRFAGTATSAVSAAGISDPTGPTPSRARAPAVSVSRAAGPSPTSGTRQKISGASTRPITTPPTD